MTKTIQGLNELREKFDSLTTKLNTQQEKQDGISKFIGSVDDKVEFLLTNPDILKLMKPEEINDNEVSKQLSNETSDDDNKKKTWNLVQVCLIDIAMSLALSSISDSIALHISEASRSK